MAQNRLQHILRVTTRAKHPHALGRMLIGGRVRVVREALVVEVVHQPREPPALGIFPELHRVRPHRRLHRQHVRAKRFARGVLVHQRERVFARWQRGVGAH